MRLLLITRHRGRSGESSLRHWLCRHSRRPVCVIPRESKWLGGGHGSAQVLSCRVHEHGGRTVSQVAIAEHDSWGTPAAPAARLQCARQRSGKSPEQGDWQVRINSPWHVNGAIVCRGGSPGAQTVRAPEYGAPWEVTRTILSWSDVATASVTTRETKPEIQSKPRANWHMTMRSSGPRNLDTVKVLRTCVIMFKASEAHREQQSYVRLRSFFTFPYALVRPFKSDLLTSKQLAASHRPGSVPSCPRTRLRAATSSFCLPSFIFQMIAL